MVKRFVARQGLVHSSLGSNMIMGSRGGDETSVHMRMQVATNSLELCREMSVAEGVIGGVGHDVERYRNLPQGPRSVGEVVANARRLASFSLDRVGAGNAAYHAAQALDRSVAPSARLPSLLHPMTKEGLAKGSRGRSKERKRTNASVPSASIDEAASASGAAGTSERKPKERHG